MKSTKLPNVRYAELYAMKLVAYYRVSTARQGRSGLGLQAQESAVHAYARSVGGEVVGSFTEVESGKRDDRPQLAAAMQLAKATGATLVIAKLDRLSRSAAFLMQLQESAVRFIAADMPNANDTTIGIMAVIARAEREAISERTKAALVAAKARGVKLGNPRGAAALRRAGKGNAAALATLQANADDHAQMVGPFLRELREAGVSSLGAIAEALNARGVLTPRGKRWHKSSVRNALLRVEL